MRKALRVCKTVQDFEHFLDTLPRPMRIGIGVSTEARADVVRTGAQIERTLGELTRDMPCLLYTSRCV